jgi:preprotein translocase subunit SecF
VVRTRSLSETDPEAQRQRVLSALSAEYGTVNQQALQSVGATVSAESTRSAVIAVIAACVAILVYLTLAFRRAPHPVRYGICAIPLFLTALLTVISFSVHDTIVVFDRIRENLVNRRPTETFDDIVNHSIVQTLPRSVNTQLTTFFTLMALILFGGESIRNLVLILLIGLVSGTYSSIFNAAQLLVVWENREWSRWFRRSAPPGAEAPAA